MHNLSTVIKFEIVRTLKKKSFWLMALGFPLMIGAIFGIIFLSNKATNDAAEQLVKQQFSIEITDNSKLIKPELIAAINASTAATKQQGIEDVKQGRVDGYIYYPANIVTQPIEVYGQDVGLFENNRYESVAKDLLLQSVEASVSPETKTVIAGEAKSSITTFRNGEAYDTVAQMILPGVFLVLFYLLISFFGSQMLTSTTEEKENRVIEMILTTIEARTLIIGKIISLILLAFFQGALIVVPALLGYLLFHEQLNIPALDLSNLPVDWARIGTGAAIFAAGLVMFTGLLVLIGASVPTAKEAGQFFGMIMMLIFGPLYAFSLFLSAPDSPFVRFLSLFPLTAPIPLLLRNAIGNLHPWEIAVAIPVMIITATIILILAVRVFRYGALEYTRKVSLREMFTRKG